MLPGSQDLSYLHIPHELGAVKKNRFLKNCLRLKMSHVSPLEGRQIVWHTPEDSPWSFRRPHPPISGEFQAWATRTCQQNPKQLGVPEPLTIPPVSWFFRMLSIFFLFFLFVGCRVFMGWILLPLKFMLLFCIHCWGAPFFLRVLQMPVTVATDSVRDVAHAVPTSEYPRWQSKPQGVLTSGNLKKKWIQNEY